MVSPDPRRCPICGQPNQCRIAAAGDAAAGSSCWCFDIAIAPARLAAVPAPARGRACICATCAGVTDAPPPARPPGRADDRPARGEK